MPWRSLLTVNCSPPGKSATSNLALLTSIPTTTCSTICPPPPVSSPPGFSLPCGAIRAWLSLATVRALTWRLGAWRPRSATVSMDSGEHGLPRLSFSLVWDSSDKIQGDSNRRSSLAYSPLEAGPDVQPFSTRTFQQIARRIILWSALAQRTPSNFQPFVSATSPQRGPAVRIPLYL